MAVVNDAPKNLRLSDFRSVSLDHEGLQRSCRFLVRILPVGSRISRIPNISVWLRDMPFLCETADMPGRSFEKMGVRYYGPYEYFPLISNYTDSEATFSILCRNRSRERELFDSWMAMINPPNTFDYAYKDEYKAEIDIFQFSDVGEDAGDTSRERWRINFDSVATYKITLVDAWPSMIASQPLSWSDDNFTRLMVTFTYTKWIRKGMDKQSNMYPLIAGRTSL